MAQAHPGTKAGRRVATILLVLGGVLISAGLAVVFLYLFPVVEQVSDHVQLIGPNPIGFWLILMGVASLAASLIVFVRRTSP